MFTLFFDSDRIYSWGRDFLNCWLSYALSQPVDLDITMMVRFAISFLGLPVILDFFTYFAQSIPVILPRNTVPSSILQKAFIKNVSDLS